MPCTEIPEDDFTLYKGDDKTKSYRYKADTLAVDISGYQIFFECTVATLSREAVIVDALDGRYDIIFVKADTVDLLESRVKYEVVFYPTGITGEKVTKYKGSINLVNEVVR